MFPAIRGVGRFESIGLPSPEFLAYFVASFEILCGILILLGLLTRFASLPLLIIMLVALVTTKIPIFLEDGLWVVLHAFRTDFAMTVDVSSLSLKVGVIGHWIKPCFNLEKEDSWPESFRS